MILSVIDRIDQFVEYKFLPVKQPDKLKLLKWVKVNKERFNEILNIITKAKNDEFKTNVDGRETTIDNAESLLKDILSGKINKSQFKKRCNNIIDDVDAILQKPMLTRSQKKKVEILSLLTEIPKFKDKKQMNNQTLQICLN